MSYYLLPLLLSGTRAGKMRRYREAMQLAACGSEPCQPERDLIGDLRFRQGRTVSASARGFASENGSAPCVPPRRKWRSFR